MIGKYLDMLIHELELGKNCHGWTYLESAGNSGVYIAITETFWSH